VRELSVLQHLLQLEHTIPLRKNVILQKFKNAFHQIDVVYH